MPEVVDQQREVLPERGRGPALDQVELLATGVEPRTSEPERGPVGAWLQAQHLRVEVQRLVDVGDVDRHVVDSERSHVSSLPPTRTLVKRGDPYPFVIHAEIWADRVGRDNCAATRD